MAWGPDDECVDCLNPKPLGAEVLALGNGASSAAEGVKGRAQRPAEGN